MQGLLGMVKRVETLAIALVVLAPVLGVLTGRQPAPQAPQEVSTASVQAYEPADRYLLQVEPDGVTPGAAEAGPPDPPMPEPHEAVRTAPAPAASAPATGETAVHARLPVAAVGAEAVDRLLETTELSSTDALILAELERRGRLGLLFPEAVDAAEADPSGATPHADAVSAATRTSRTSGR